MEQARTHFRSGVRLHQEGNLEAAYAEFSRAQELVPHYQVSFNLAQTAFALGYYGVAQREFESYLREGGERVASERRGEVEQKLEQIGRLVGTLHLSCLGTEAQLLLDGSVVGTCPVNLEIVVAAGRHNVSLEGPTLERNRRVDVAVAQVLDVSFDFAPDSNTVGAGEGNNEGADLPADEELAASPYLQPVEASQPSSGFWWGMGAAATLGLGAVGTGISALAANGRAKKEVDQSPPDDDKVERANRSAQNLAIATDILLGAAIVTAGVSLAIEWPFHASSSEHGAAGGKASPESISIDLGAGPRQVTLSLQF